jgi:hypothetical protein
MMSPAVRSKMPGTKHARRRPGRHPGAAAQKKAQCADAENSLPRLVRVLQKQPPDHAGPSLLRRIIVYENLAKKLTCAGFQMSEILAPKAWEES